MVKQSQKQCNNLVDRPKIERKYLTVTYIRAGIIELIEENGQIALYRQRGINQIHDNLKIQLISNGFLIKDWYKYKELPKNYSISYEDEAIMGKARASFPINYFKGK